MLIRSLTIVFVMACGSSQAVAGNITNLNPLKTYGFQNISGNNATDAAIGEAQLAVQIYGWDGSAVTDSLTEESVVFIFRNEGPNAASITDVYFDDGALLALSDLIDANQNGGQSGVNFTEGASPGNLPSANNASPPFVTTAGFSADSDPAVQPNGVNPGEQLGVIFSLKKDSDDVQLTVADVIAAMDRALAGNFTDELRIGIHVQGFNGGGSESFVNGPPPTGEGPPFVPEPASVILMVLGGLGLLAYAHRRRKLQLAG